MARLKLPARVFPELELPDETRGMLLAEGQQVIDETLRASDAFALGGKRVSRQQWKLLKRKESLRVYRDRRRARRQHHHAALAGGASAGSVSMIDYNAGDGFTPALPELDPVITSNHYYRESDESSSGFTLEEEKAPSDEIVQALKPSELPLLMVEGTVEGTLDDFMLGSIDDSTEGQPEATYFRGKFDDSRLLATVAVPTLEKPYEFASIKWLLKDQPPVVNTLIKARDHVILEMAGVTTDEQDRPIGFHLFHSVCVPEFRELKEFGVIRANISFCMIVRPSAEAEAHIDVYCRGYTDARGGLPVSISTFVASSVLLVAADVNECALGKKLAWMVECNRAEPKPLQRSFSREIEHTCATCRRKSSKFLSKASGVATCRICNENVCSKCRVEKTMFIDSLFSSGTPRAHCFCVKCLQAAKHVNPRRVAAAMITRSQSKWSHNSRQSSSDSVTSSSR